MFKNIITGISNIFRYLKLVWKDRDWDHAFVERLLLFKYKRMYARFRNPDLSYVDWKYTHKEDLQALKITIIILERRASEWYMNLLKHDFTNEEAHIVYGLEKRDWKILCNIQDKYFQSWWD